MRARRLEVVDEYAEDARVAIYSRAGMVVVLSELAAVAWAALGDDWVEADAVAGVLVRTFGTPPDGDPLAATEGALRTLAEHELVELEGD